jgi:hypothetical protein
MLAALPTTEDVSALLAAARKGEGRQYSLPWVVEAKGLLYTLACLVTPEEVDPQWMLAAGGVAGGLSSETIWSHSSPDLDLILNLCLMECDASQVPVQAKDSQTAMSELRALVSGSDEPSHSAPRERRYGGPSETPGVPQAIASAPTLPPGQYMPPHGHPGTDQATSQPAPAAPQSVTPPPAPMQAPLGMLGQMPGQGLAPPGGQAPLAMLGQLGGQQPFGQMSGMAPPIPMPNQALAAAPGQAPSQAPAPAITPAPEWVSSPDPAPMPVQAQGQLQGQAPYQAPGQVPGLAPEWESEPAAPPVLAPGQAPEWVSSPPPGQGTSQHSPTQAEVVAALSQSVDATSTHGAAIPSPQNTVQGRLEDLPPNNLLQSASNSKMTGRLTVSENQENISLFFEDGGLVHGTCRQGDGEIAVLELLTWTRGFYAFVVGETPPEKTIQRRIDAVVIECLQLVHNLQYLERAGLNADTYLVRRNLSMTETDFDNQTRAAHCPNKETLKGLYQQIDQTSTFLELLRKFPVSKMEWLPALYALVTTGLVELSQKPAQAGKTADLGAVGVDVASVKNAYAALVRPDTGIMPFPMLLYFLEQEFYRYERARMPFSLFVFSIAKDAGYGLAPLDEGETRRLAQVVDGLKRKTDMLGHFQNFDYAMILPMTNISGAMIFANKVLDIVNGGGICGGAPQAKVFFTGGVSCMPDDTMKVELMLPAAVEAKNAARDAGRGLMAYASILKKF